MTPPCFGQSAVHKQLRHACLPQESSHHKHGKAATHAHTDLHEAVVHAAPALSGGAAAVGALHVAAEAQALVLREHVDLVDLAVDAVAERHVDQPVLAGNGHGGQRSLGGQRPKRALCTRLAACQHQSHYVALVPHAPGWRADVALHVWHGRLWVSVPAAAARSALLLPRPRHVRCIHRALERQRASHLRLNNHLPSYQLCAAGAVIRLQLMRLSGSWPAGLIRLAHGLGPGCQKGAPLRGAAARAGAGAASPGGAFGGGAGDRATCATANATGAPAALLQPY